MFSVSASQYEAFWANGYCIFRDVFTPAEIAAFREHAQTLPVPAPDLLSDEMFRDVVADARLTAIAARLLDSVPVHFGDSTLSRAERPGPWHKDNAGRYDASTADWSSRYPLLRFGIYLQDHRRHSGGVSVRHQSHTSPTRDAGKPVYVDTGIGDVVVWHFRATHRGATSLLRGTRIPISHYRLDKYLPSVFKAPTDAARMAFFITYGAAGDDTDRYVEYLATREYAVERARLSSYDEQWLSGIDRDRLIIRDTRAEILSAPPEQVSRKHRDY